MGQPLPPADQNPADTPDEPVPITPHATPVVDPNGRITYLGEDGRRYVVGDAPSSDGAD